MNTIISAMASPRCSPPSTWLNGAVLVRCMTQHRHREFICFLNAVERAMPTGKMIHSVLDNWPSISAKRMCLACRSPTMGSFTSRRHRRPSATPSKAFPPPSPAGASGAASSNPLPISRTPSPAMSASTIRPQNSSRGPNLQMPVSPNSPDCLYLPNESVR